VIGLTNGALLLNQKTLWLKNPAGSGSAAAITRVNGWIQSDDLPPAAGSLKWSVGTNVTSHVFPFGTSDGAYVPFTFTNTAGNVGDVTVSTYPTLADNTPWPPTVTHLNDFATGANKSVANVVDRFWNISKTGPSGNPTMVFGWAIAERPPCPVCGVDNSLMPQKWESPNGNGVDGWRIFPNPPIHSFANNTAALNPTGIPVNGIWAITNLAEPLPIELLTFNATLVKDKVKIWWSTASEINNDYFTVERTVNQHDFDFIATVKSQGSSARIQDYHAFDYSPVPGIQYYRLKTTDIDGNSDYSKLVPVRYGKEDDFQINYVISQTGSNSLDVVFTYNSHEPYTYSIKDLPGRILTSKSGNAGFPGLNTINIPVNMVKGVYFVVIENTEKKVTSKIVY